MVTEQTALQQEVAEAAAARRNVAVEKKTGGGDYWQAEQLCGSVDL